MRHTWLTQSEGILAERMDEEYALTPCVRCKQNCGFVAVGMPCTQCARSAKFWMSANTRTLVSAPFHKFLVPYQGFF